MTPILAVVLAAALARTARAAPVSVQTVGDCWHDVYSFDSVSMSEDRFKELTSLAPDVSTKWMPLNWLEACQMERCSATVNDAFFENAEENQRQLTARIAQLKKLQVPKELQPAVDYYIESNSFVFWVNSVRLRFYRTWDPSALSARYYVKAAHKTIDASVACRELIAGLSRETDHAKLYAATRGGLNCANSEFQRAISFPREAWTAFLKAYKIEVKRESDEAACD